MAEINDGGPAFPRSSKGVFSEMDETGMSLRDWFAGQALIGALASEVNTALDIDQGESVEDAMERDKRRRAAWCYQQADALLAERAKDGGDR